MTTVFDNIDEQLGKRLVSTFEVSNRIDVAVGYFNFRGWGTCPKILTRASLSRTPMHGSLSV